MPSPLATRIAAKLNLSPEEAAEALDTLVAALTEQVERERIATLAGLGVFHMHEDVLTFEPDERLAMAVNYRFAGLHTVLVDAGPSRDAPAPEASAAPPEVAEEPDGPVEKLPLDALAETATEASAPVIPPAHLPEVPPAEEIPEPDDAQEESVPAPPHPSLDEPQPPASHREEATDEANLQPDLEPISSVREGDETPPVPPREVPEQQAASALEPPAEDDRTEAAGGFLPGTPEVEAEQDQEANVTQQVDSAGPAAMDAEVTQAEADVSPATLDAEPTLAVAGSDEQTLHAPRDMPASPAAPPDRPPAAPEPTSRRRWAPFVIGMFAVAVVASILFFLLNGGNEDAAPSQPALASQQETPVRAADPDTPSTPAPEEEDPAQATGEAAPPPSPTTNAEPPSAAQRPGLDRAAGGYTLIVASDPRSTFVMSVAQEYAEQFRERNIPVEILSGTADGTTRYRVALGQFETADEADAARQRLTGELPEGTWVMAVPPPED